MTTRSFGPSDKDLSDPVLPANAMQAQPAVASGTESHEQWARAETDAITRQSIAHEVDELMRCHQETTERLSRLTAELQTDHAIMAKRLESLATRSESLASVRAFLNGPVDLTALAGIRREIHAAQHDIVRFETEIKRRSSPQSFRLSTLSFGELSRLGLALSWPLILAVMLAAVFLTIAILVAWGEWVW